MTIENIALSLEAEEINPEEAYTALIDHEDEGNAEEAHEIIESMYAESDISEETRDMLLSFLE